MKSYSNLFEEVIDADNLTEAIRESSRGKRQRDDVLDVFDNIDYHIKVIQNMLINEEFVPKKHKICHIKDGTTKKDRIIIKPSYQYEQIIHHAVIRVIYEDLLLSSYRYSCGSMPSKGIHLGAKAIKKWIKTDYKNTKYVFKCDIHHFFGSIDLKILYKKLNKKYGKDVRFMRLIKKILNVNKKGLPLGYYTSQWFANYYLQEFDYYVKQVLKVKYYVRYMDDMVFFASSKQELHEIKKKIENFLNNKLKLELKDNWQVFKFNYYNKKTKRWQGRFLDFMGFRFYRNKTTLRKNILIRMTKKARQINKTGVNWYNASAMLSYMGYVKHSNSYGVYCKYIKPYVNIKQLKKVVSKHSRRMNEREKLRMEERERKSITETTRDRYELQPKLCIP